MTNVTDIDMRPDNERFPDLMTDLETTGLNKGRNAIIQIAAVKFNLFERTVSHNFFDRCLDIPPTRAWDEGTRSWWLEGDKRKVLLESIMPRMEKPAIVLEDFRTFCFGRRKFWGKPSHFDYAFLESYYQDLGEQMPVYYRTAENMHSWARARYWPEAMPEWEWHLPFVGDKHNALHDCLHQIKSLFAVADDTGVTKKGNFDKLQDPNTITG